MMDKSYEDIDSNRSHKPHHGGYFCPGEEAAKEYLDAVKNVVPLNTLF
jgi:hypothetical protein